MNRQTVSVPITNDDVYELNEIFDAVISEITVDPGVEITQPMSAVEILNDDSKSPSSKVTSLTRTYYFKHTLLLSHVCFLFQTPV